jgi:large subunit ribosomal protein L29
MKSVEARDMESEDLLERIRELKQELFNLRFQLATGQLDNHRRVRLVKREVGMIRTVLRERDLYEQDQVATGAAEAQQEESTETGE